jgi:hypothetical protein
MSNNFVVGKMFTNITHWRSITSDEIILDYVRGYSIEFTEIPFQNSIPKPIKFNDNETSVIDKRKIKEMLSIGIIELATEKDDNECFQYICAI